MAASAWMAPATVLILMVIALVGRLVHRHAPDDDCQFIMRLFWWGISIRLILSIIAHVAATYYEMGYPYLLYGQQSHDLFGDSAVTSLRAFWMAQYWEGKIAKNVIDLSAIFGDKTSLLIRFYGGFYYLFGYSPLALKWIHCLLGTLGGIVAYSLGRLVCNDQKIAGRIAGISVMFFPSNLLWSLSNLKETPTILALSLILWLVLRLQRRFRWRDLGWLVICIGLLWVARWTVVIPTLTSLLFTGWVLWRVKWWKKILLTVGLVTALSIGVQRYEHQPLGPLIQQRLIAFGHHLISVQRGHVLGQGVNYCIYPERVYDISLLGFPGPYLLSRAEWAWAIIKGWLYFLFVPFPWKISTISQLVAYPEIVLWYALIPVWMSGIFVGFHSHFRETVTIISLAIVLSVAAGLATGNIGTAFRHRAIVVPLFLLLATMGLCQRASANLHAS